jgi:hypothetical protein
MVEPRRNMQLSVKEPSKEDMRLRDTAAHTDANMLAFSLNRAPHRKTDVVSTLRDSQFSHKNICIRANVFLCIPTDSPGNATQIVTHPSPAYRSLALSTGECNADETV